MANLFQFKPKAEVTAEENLSAFIDKCRNELTVFGTDLNWSAFVWPKVAVFAKMGVTTRKPAQEQLMDDNFVDFAKAYFRYQQGHKPTGTKNELTACLWIAWMRRLSLLSSTILMALHIIAEEKSNGWLHL